MASSANDNTNLSCLSTNSGIVRQLISRIEELSQAISPSDSVRNSNNIINGEVRRIFTATGTARVGVGATNENNEASNVVTATTPATSIHQVPRTGQPYVIPSSSREERLPIRRNAFSARRYFPGLVENAGTRICGYAGMRICGYAGMRICGYAGMRVCGYAGMRICGYADMRICGYVELV